MPQADRRRAAGYCRVSTADQAERGFSLEEQERAMREDTARRGENWTTTYVDRGLSGRGTEKRHELKQMLAAAQDSQFDVLVIPSLDRLGRNTRDVLSILGELEEAGVAVRSLRGEVDTSTAAGKLTTTIFSGLAEFESNVIGERTRSGMAAAARKGRRNGGPRPFGFDQGDARLVPRSDEVAVAERFFREYVSGKPQNEIARDLNRDGHQTAQGKRWHQAQISQQLRDPKWIGHTQRKVDGDLVVFKDMHPAVIPLELFELAQQMLTSSGRRGRQTRRFLVGNGLLRCGRCGSAMRVMPKSKSWRTQDYYGCLGRYDGRADCDQPVVPREPIDRAIIEYFQNVALDVDAMVEEHSEDRSRRLRDIRARVTNAQKTASRAQDETARVDGLLRSGDITTDEWRRLVDPAQMELAASEAALGDLRDEEQAIRAEDDLADAEQETLVALAEMRARFANGIANADDVEAAQAALRRLFSHLILHDLRDARNGGKPFVLPKGRLYLPAEQRLINDHRDDWIIEPVPHDRMIVTDPVEVQGWVSERARLKKVPLQTTKGGSKASAR